VRLPTGPAAARAGTGPGDVPRATCAAPGPPYPWLEEPEPRPRWDIRGDRRHCDRTPGAAAPHTPWVSHGSQREGIKEAVGLLRDGEGAGGGPQEQGCRRMGLEEEELLVELSFI